MTATKRFTVRTLKGSNKKKVYKIQKRGKNIRWTNQEKRTLLKSVNTIGKSKWKVIMKAHRKLFEKNNRTNVKLKDQYRTLVKHGLAIDDFDVNENHDCYTSKARRKFNLKHGEKDDAFSIEHAEHDEEEEEEIGEH